MPNEPRGAGRAAALALPLLMWACALGAAHASPAAGETLYRRGLLPSGEPVRAVREAGASMQGTDAACVNCHRRSGLGSSEGRITIRRFPDSTCLLRRQASGRAGAFPFVDTARLNHEPYTDATLARAIREGSGASGRPLNYLMPALSDR